MPNETIITIDRKFNRPSAELLKPFSDIPTGYVVDVQERRGALDCSIKPMFDFPSIDGLQAIREKERKIEALIAEGLTKPDWVKEFLASDRVKYIQ